MTRGRFWPRELTRLTTNPARAIYGTIVATAVTAASSEHEPIGTIAAAVTVTLVVFWIAHVYSAVL
ncbi:MAG TPA: hypothetical protein VKB69_03595, partial [Micromonosporaceae bacterium]|nr:hypothetical protein [Micromonosporaceae bacterium]